MKYLENLNPVIKTRSLDISLFLELWCHNTKGYLVKKCQGLQCSLHWRTDVGWNKKGEIRCKDFLNKHANKHPNSTSQFCSGNLQKYRIARISYQM